MYGPPGRRTAYPTKQPSRPTIAVTVRSQHEGRALVVLTLAEVGRLLMMAEGGRPASNGEGTATSGSGRQMDEYLAAHDLARGGYPLDQPLAAGLAF